MRDDDEIDLLGLDPGAVHVLDKPPRRSGVRPRAVAGVDQDQPLPGVDDHGRVGVLDRFGRAHGVREGSTDLLDGRVGHEPGL
jgi:hypothetical protein